MTEFSAAEHFSQTLAEQGISISRRETNILQINVGLLCNQTCRHCHLKAGPKRTEIMGPETVDAVTAYAARCSFKTIDITGGAPELNPNIDMLINGLAPLASKLMFRSNLTALSEEGERNSLMQLLQSSGAAIVASFPSLNASQTDAQRGQHVFQRSIDALKKLNDMGYGHPGTGLELSLVSNPTGAFLPPDQAQTEKRFRDVLHKKTGIVFNDFFSFANVPLGRFRDWLITSGNYDAYMHKLASAFNPAAVEGVMCRSMVSVSWDGYLYDCDFNQAENLRMAGLNMHVSKMPGPPDADTPILTGNHCYSCTAGAGFT